MKIKDIMIKPVFLAPKDTKEQIFSLVKNNPSTDLFIVVDNDNKFLGDIHINDIFLMFLPNENYDDIGIDIAFDIEKKFFATTAEEVMRKHDFRCDPDDDLLEVAVKLAGLEVNEMPVIDDTEKVVGYITEGLLVRYLKE